MNYLGIDIGCSAIKFGIVEIYQDVMVKDFDMVMLPQPSKTEDFTNALLHIIENTTSYDAIGIGFPTVVWEDCLLDLETRFNDIWIEVSRFIKSRNLPCFAINDADAAGFAEVHRPSADYLRKGVTIVITLGTGIGTGTFLEGKLFPNTEFGMVEVDGVMAEHFAAASVKRHDGLSMEEWAIRLQKYLVTLEVLVSPDHIILGGGISSDFDQFGHFLKPKRAKLLPAYFRNQAGVIGAAMNTAKKIESQLILETGK